MQNSKSLLGKYWQQRQVNEDFAKQIGFELQLNDLLARIISTRVNDIFAAKNYIAPKIKNLLPSPFHLNDMDKAVSRLIDAILNHEKICIFADYDVDGATSSALIKNVLQEINVKSDIYVPDRIVEGYGPTPGSMKKISQQGAKLLITVDCGSVAFEALENAYDAGLDTIVIDHHISLDRLPKAVAVVNPNRLDETSKYKNLAAVGVSFLFMIGVISKLRELNFFKKHDIIEPNLIKQLDIVALGTVCDVMQLTDLNRALVAQGIKIAQQRTNIGYRALCDIAGLEEPINCYHLGFILGPRINAGGRVGKSYLGANLLSTKSEVEAKKFAAELDIHNNDRKAIELSVIESAKEHAKQQADLPMLFISQEGWHPGVIGIVAGRLKEIYNKPVAVIALNGEIGKASCRSIKGVDFGTALIEANNQGLLIAGGGHAMAAGFTVERSKLVQLQQFLNNQFAKALVNSQEHLLEHFDCYLTSKAANIDLINEIARLEPFGHGNPSPVFKFEKMYVLKADIVGEKHIRTLLAPSYEAHGGTPLASISFGTVGTAIGEVLMSPKPMDISVFGNLKINKWNNRETVQLHIKDVIVE